MDQAVQDEDAPRVGSTSIPLHASRIDELPQHDRMRSFTARQLGALVESLLTEPRDPFDGISSLIDRSMRKGWFARHDVEEILRRHDARLDAGRIGMSVGFASLCIAMEQFGFRTPSDEMASRTIGPLKRKSIVTEHELLVLWHASEKGTMRLVQIAPDAGRPHGLAEAVLAGGYLCE